MRACLASLTRLEYSFERLEIIVVDDGSLQPLDGVVQVWQDRLPVRLVRQHNTGPAAARNGGVSHARGELLAFTDDDCAPQPGWLRAMSKQLAQSPKTLVGGRTVNALRHNPYASASQLLIDYLYEQWNDRAGQARFFASNNMAMHTDEFRALGGFDVNYIRAASEDREFCERWSAAGGALSYVPEAVILHSHDLTFGSLWRQHFTYGQGAWQFYQSRAARGGQFFKPDPRFYAGLLRYPFRRLRRRQSDVGPVSLLLLLLLTQGASFAGFMTEKRQSP